MDVLELFKMAAASPLKGRLYLSQTGFLLMAVPNAIGRGMFSAMNEPGIELPQEYGQYNCHCTIMTPEEVTSVGASNITERGRDFSYQLGPVREITFAADSPYSKVWAASVSSPELAKLRRSYGLSSQTANASRPFHCTIGVRKKLVLNSTTVSKTLRAPRHAWISRLSNLVGNEGALQSKVSCVLPELRGSRDSSMPVLVRELFGVPEGYGRTAAGSDTRSDRFRCRLQSEELSLGYEKRAGQEQAEQPANYGVRTDQDVGGMVRTAQDRLHQRDQQTGQLGMVGRGRDQHSGRRTQQRTSPAYVQGKDTDAGRVVKRARDFGHNDPSAAAVRLDSGGSVGNTAAERQAVYEAGNSEDSKTAKQLDPSYSPEHPEECCPHCGARLERGDDGDCNRCGKPWPKEAAATCPGCGEKFPKGEPYPDVKMCERCERFGPPKAAGDITIGQAVARAARKAVAPKSEAQADAGNYQKGHVSMHGLSVSIETKKGDKRSPEWPALQNHYGYIRRTTDADGDSVDVFIGGSPGTELVFVVDQVDPGTQKFDEHKCMLGFNTLQEAKDAYLANYEKDWQGLGKITPLTMQQFKEWLKDGSQTRPVSTQTFKMKKAFDVSGGRSDDSPDILVLRHCGAFNLVIPSE